MKNLLSQTAGTAGPSILTRLASELSLTLAYVVSAMPRAALAIVMASVPMQAMAREYVRQHRHATDRPSWRVMTARRVTRASEAELAAVAVGQLLRNAAGHHAMHNVVVPVPSPAFPGYPAALTAIRIGPDFTAAEIEQIQAATRDWGGSTAASSAGPPAFLAIDDAGNVRFAGTTSDASTLAGCQKQFRVLATELAQEELPAASRARWVLKLPGGIDTPYRAVRYVEYPALGGGPATLLARAPAREHWLAIRPEAIHADGDFSRFLPAVQMIARGFARQPSLRELAAAVQLSPFHFHRTFAEATGATPKHLILDCQIETAKEALRSSRQNMRQIARLCGFAHQSHFTSRFKQATGLTPSQWRRMTQLGGRFQMG
ncbi:MAG: AraC family transcriptional regulator [Phycisphaerae bacterium]|nr:AraC family transcriptional regulator [Phycisphaerae bacterium]MDW8262113.1 AraC family transcriptional regulator [Phycisphaerales bacterium]